MHCIYFLVARSDFGSLSYHVVHRSQAIHIRSIFVAHAQNVLNKEPQRSTHTHTYDKQTADLFNRIGKFIVLCIRYILFTSYTQFDNRNIPTKWKLLNNDKDLNMIPTEFHA